MRLEDFLNHPLLHAALSDVGIDDHHDRPENIEVSNTTLSVSPLPGGPGVWDIAMPYNARVVLFVFRSAHVMELAGARSGVTGVATRSSIQASAASIGGARAMTQASKSAFYAKPGGALNLSDKIFSAAGDYISLSDAWLHETVPGTTRVLRTQWTNYGASYYTLNVHGEIGVIG